MNQEHAYVIPVKLRYHFAENKINKYKLSETAELDVTANGWKLLKALFIERTVDLELKGEVENNIFWADENISLFTDELPSGIHINTIQPDSIVFQVDKKLSKKVPVILQSVFILQKNFNFIEPVKMQPDSITITGPASVVEKYTSWKTGLIRKEKLSQSFTGTISLLQDENENITLSAIAVLYEVKVEKFIDKTFEIALKGDSSQTVTVHCKIPESRVDSISADDFVVAPQIQNDTMKFVLISYPERLINVELYPLFILKEK